MRSADDSGNRREAKVRRHRASHFRVPGITETDSDRAITGTGTGQVMLGRYGFNPDSRNRYLIVSLGAQL